MIDAVINEQVPNKYLHLLSRFLLEEQGIDLVDICKQQQVSFSQDASDFIDSLGFAKVCEVALAHLKNKNLGLKFGSTLSFTNFGPLGAAMMSCKTLEDVLTLIMNYSQGTFPFNISLEKNHQHLKITQHLPSHFNASILFHIHIFYSGCLQFFKELSGFTPLDLELQFPCEKPNSEQLKIYEHYLPVSLKFEQPNAAMLIPLSYLSYPLPRHDEISKETFVKMCQQIKERFTQKKPLSEKIMTLLDTYEHYPSIEQLSNILHVSPRTLRHHLQKEGCRFSDLVTQHKLNRAKDLLKNTQLSIELIAEQVGYQEATSFYKVFKKMTQLTPLQYRNSPHH